jgi:hypothetical protein
VRILDRKRGLPHPSHAAHCGSAHRLHYGGRFFLHEDGVESIEFLRPSRKASDPWRHDKRPRRWPQCLRTALCCSNNSALALFWIHDAEEVLINGISKEPAQGQILAAQNDDVPLFLTLRPICVKAPILPACVLRNFVVVREQNNEIARLLNALVHVFQEICANRDVVVLHKD